MNLLQNLNFTAEQELILTFAVLSLFNVMFSTVKTIITNKGNKYLASLMNGLYYSFYNIVLIYTVAEFNSTAKFVITFFSNIIGVFIVKYVEEKVEAKLKKDTRRVYSVTCEETHKNVKKIHYMLLAAEIENYYNEIVKDRLYTVEIFSNTRQDSNMIEDVLDNFNAAYHVIDLVNRKKSKKLKAKKEEKN